MAMSTYTQRFGGPQAGIDMHDPFVAPSAPAWPRRGRDHPYSASIDDLSKRRNISAFPRHTEYDAPSGGPPGSRGYYGGGGLTRSRTLVPETINRAGSSFYKGANNDDHARHRGARGGPRGGYSDELRALREEVDMLRGKLGGRRRGNGPRHSLGLGPDGDNVPYPNMQGVSAITGDPQDSAIQQLRGQLTDLQRAQNDNARSHHHETTPMEQEMVVLRQQLEDTMAQLRDLEQDPGTYVDTSTPIKRPRNHHSPSPQRGGNVRDEGLVDGLPRESGGTRPASPDRHHTDESWDENHAHAHPHAHGSPSRSRGHSRREREDIRDPNEVDLPGNVQRWYPGMNMAPTVAYYDADGKEIYGYQPPHPMEMQHPPIDVQYQLGVEDRSTYIVYLPDGSTKEYPHGSRPEDIDIHADLHNLNRNHGGKHSHGHSHSQGHARSHSASPRASPLARTSKGNKPKAKKRFVL